MEMVEVKTVELIGPALDWAVDVATASIFDLHPERTKKVVESILMGNYSPSTNWNQGGPLIEKYLAAFCVEHEDVILAVLCDDYGMYVSGWRQGDTHLIAACRAIVAAKLGDTAWVPAALVGGDA